MNHMVGNNMETSHAPNFGDISLRNHTATSSWQDIPQLPCMNQWKNLSYECRIGCFERLVLIGY
jgi:hypothetical protein